MNQGDDKWDKMINNSLSYGNDTCRRISSGLHLSKAISPCRACWLLQSVAATSDLALPMSTHVNCKQTQPQLGLVSLLVLAFLADAVMKQLLLLCRQALLLRLLHKAWLDLHPLQPPPLLPQDQPPPPASPGSPAISPHRSQVCNTTWRKHPLLLSFPLCHGSPELIGKATAFFEKHCGASALHPSTCESGGTLKGWAA